MNLLTPSLRETLSGRGDAALLQTTPEEGGKWQVFKRIVWEVRGGGI